MNVSGLIKKATNKTVLFCKEHAPEILMIIGASGVVTGTVMACKATIEAKEVVEEFNGCMHELDEWKGRLAQNTEISEEKRNETGKKLNRDGAVICVKTGAKLAKIYGPAMIVEACSIGVMFASNTIMRKRMASIAAAYVAVDTSFKEYRKRVAERFGNDVEFEIRNGVKTVEVEEKITDENGNETTEITTKTVAGPESDYICYFTKSNPYWENDPYYLEMFFNSRQSIFNDRLKARGFMTLNEARKDLGFPETKAGMVVGWIYDEDRPIGDNYIQLDVNKVTIQDVDGEYDEAYAIDFNVDGNIYNHMAK